MSDPNHDRATTYHVLADTQRDRAYWQGYLTGARRRLAGGVQTNDLEAEAFTEMLKAADDVRQALGRGYRDGLEGKSVGGGGIE